MKKFLPLLMSSALLFVAFSANARNWKDDIPMYQKYDGKQAYSTGCYRDAITANSKTFRDNTFYRVRVELRYSPSCGTNWARIYYEQWTTTYDSKMDDFLIPDFVELMIMRSASAKPVIYKVFNSNKTGIYYTPMIYAKNDLAIATLTFIPKTMPDHRAGVNGKLNKVTIATWR